MGCTFGSAISIYMRVRAKVGKPCSLDVLFQKLGHTLIDDRVLTGYIDDRA